MVVKQLLANKEVCYLKSDSLFLHNQRDPKEFSNESFKEYLDLLIYALIFLKDLQNMHHFFLNHQLFFRLFYTLIGKREFDWLHFVIAKLFTNSFINHSYPIISSSYLCQIYKIKIYYLFKKNQI